MKTQHKFCSKLISLIVCTIIIIGCVFAINQPISSMLEKAQQTAFSFQLRNLDTNGIYYLKAVGGYVGVFMENGSQPVEVYKIDINSFSDTDKEILTKGVRYEGLNQLKKGIEDFCG